MRRARLVPFALVIAVASACGERGPVRTKDEVEAQPSSRVAAKREAPRLSPAEKFLDVPIYGDRFIDDSGYALASRFTGTVEDRGDLGQVVASIRGRNRRGSPSSRRTWRRSTRQTRTGRNSG